MSANPKFDKSADTKEPHVPSGTAPSLGIYPIGDEPKNQTQSPKKRRRGSPYRDLGRIENPASPATLLRESPRRPVNWRWQCVQRALDSKEPLSQSQNDKQMAATYRFLEVLWRRCKTEDDLIELAESGEPNNSIFLAMELAIADDLLTWIFQARLLTREPFSDLAKRVGYPVEAVRWYRDLFYDVQDKLQTPGYILHQAIGPQVHHFDCTDQKTYLKLMGYIGGPKVVDAILYPWSEAAHDPEVVQFFRGEFQMLIAMKVASAARLLQATNPKEAKSYLKVWQRSQEMEARHRSRRVDAPGDIQRNITAFFEELDRCSQGKIEQLYNSFSSKPGTCTSETNSVGSVSSAAQVDDDPLLAE